MELKVLDNKGQESSSVQFDETQISAKGSPAVLHEVITAHRAAQRAGTHSTKTKAEVSGGGIKPWKQKGTGRARSGSTRSPLWRHGGIIFGPRPRSYRQDLPKKKKQLAFRMAFLSAITENRIQVVEPIELTEPKTKFVVAVYEKWQAPTDSLFVVENVEASFNKASRNIGRVQVMNVGTLNTYDCLRARRIFITEQALNQLSARLKTSEN